MVNEIMVSMPLENAVKGIDAITRIEILKNMLQSSDYVSNSDLASVLGITVPRQKEREEK